MASLNRYGDSKTPHATKSALVPPVQKRFLVPPDRCESVSDLVRFLQGGEDDDLRWIIVPTRTDMIYVVWSDSQKSWWLVERDEEGHFTWESATEIEMANADRSRPPYTDIQIKTRLPVQRSRSAGQGSRSPRQRSLSPGQAVGAGEEKEEAQQVVVDGEDAQQVVVDYLNGNIPKLCVYEGEWEKGPNNTVFNGCRTYFSHLDIQSKKPVHVDEEVYRSRMKEGRGFQDNTLHFKDSMLYYARHKRSRTCGIESEGVAMVYGAILRHRSNGLLSR